MRLDELLLLVFTITFAVVTAFLCRANRAKPHKMLVRLVAMNVGLDFVAIAIWLIPATQWSIYRLGVLVVGGEAASAAALFALTLFGLLKRKTWAPVLAIGLTVTQRVFATYVFFPSTAIGLTTIWSLMIVFFAYLSIKTKKAVAGTNQCPKKA